MKTRFLGTVAIALLLAGAAVARAADQDDALAAAKRLEAAPNYTWTTTIQGGFGDATPNDTKMEKDGFSSFTVTGQDGTASDVLVKAGKAVAKQGGTWKTGTEIVKAANDAGGFSPEAIVLYRVVNLITPAAQAQMILIKTKDLKKTQDVYAADLPEAVAKELLAFKTPDGLTTSFPEMTTKDPKGSIKIWIKDGVLNKMEIHLTGTRSFNDQEFPVDQTTTTQIKDVDTTKIAIPDDAKKKIEEAATQPALTSTKPATQPAATAPKP